MRELNVTMTSQMAAECVRRILERKDNQRRSRRENGAAQVRQHAEKQETSLVEVAVWRSGNVVERINEVTLRRARLILGWVTVFGGQTASVFHQATQTNSASYTPLPFVMS